MDLVGFEKKAKALLSIVACTHQDETVQLELSMCTWQNTRLINNMDRLVPDAKA